MKSEKRLRNSDCVLPEEFALHELGKNVAPVGHRGKPGEAEHHLVEAGILRARSGTGKFLRGAWGNCLRFPGETEDLLCEFEPGGLALAGEVKCADEVGFREDVADLTRHGGRRGRIAVLVGDDFQHRARAVGERHHGMNEARAAMSVEPGDPANHMVRAMRPHGFLARELASPVDRVAAGRPVELVVRAVGIAVEDIVRGDGNEADAVPVACGGHVRRTECIELVRELDFTLALVNGRHGGAVDDGVGVVLRQKCIEPRVVGDVRLGEIGDRNFAVLEFVL